MSFLYFYFITGIYYCEKTRLVKAKQQMTRAVEDICFIFPDISRENTIISQYFPPSREMLLFPGYLIILFTYEYISRYTYIHIQIHMHTHLHLYMHTSIVTILTRQR